MAHTWMTADERKAIIIEAARSIAADRGVEYINGQAVADACRVPTSRETVKRYFRMSELRALVAAE